MLRQFKILIFAFAFLFWGGRCFAQSQFSPILTKMEKSLFGVDYSSQEDGARLSRIEESVYGAPSSNSTSQRVNKLSKDLSADLIGQEIQPTKDTFAKDDDGYKEDIPKSDSTVNYPIVNKLEDKVFSKEFKTQDINQRLTNLEKKVFTKTYNDDLNTRVERLRTAVIPQSMANNSDDSDDDSTPSYITDGSNNPNALTQRDFNMLRNKTALNSNSVMKDAENSQYADEDSSQNFGTQPPDYNAQNSVLDGYQQDSSVTIPLASLEKSILKRSFPDDTIANRLTRLELKIFKSTFVDDDPETRLDRLASAHQAQRTSSKYDSNKFAQHMSTAVQVGAILLMILAAVL